MTQSEIKIALDDLIQMINSGKTMEAFDKYYHDDFIGQENQTEPRIGKKVNREFEEVFLSNITQKRVYEAKSTMVGTNVSAILWDIDIDHKEWGTMKVTEINVQTWESGKIIRESYHYNI